MGAAEYDEFVLHAGVAVERLKQGRSGQVRNPALPGRDA